MITGMHHVSRGVSDMDAALGFYRDLLGMEVVLDTEMSGEMLDAEVGLDGAKLRFVLLRGSGAMPFLELLQYRAPAGRPHPADATPADVGAHHIALVVNDIRVAHERLAAGGVRFTAPPQEVDSGTLRGHWTAYCFDPDGQVVELWQLPGIAASRPVPA